MIMMDDNFKYMDLSEFQKLGFIQEINRLILHPAGLAISLEVDDNGKINEFGPILDYQDDPEGMIFNDLQNEIAITKEKNVKNLQEQHREAREKKLGFFIQPIGSKPSIDSVS